MRIYRFITFLQLVDMVERNALCFVRPNMWQDPHESYLLDCLNTEKGNAILQQFIQSKNIPFDQQTFKNHAKHLYAQSWTKLEESDALWRIYSGDCQGLRIELETEDLQSLIDEKKLFIQDVCYQKEFNLVDILDQCFDEENKTLHTTGPIFYKKKEFEHERELRLLCYQSNSLRSPTDIHYFKVTPIQHYIKSILAHPQCQWFESTLSLYCASHNLNYIGKSTLYQFDLT